MIYQTGTIVTTAGQTKIKGTGTRWKDNLNGISEGCPISYLINNVVYMNTVLSVNSDTEINLTYPVPVAATAAKYQIATFVLDSMSDGVRKMLANQQYIQYFLRNMDTWMTQDGIVEIKTPTGETVRLESIIALKKLIDGKLSLTGGTISKNGEALTLRNTSENQSLYYAIRDLSGALRGYVGAPNSGDRIAVVNSKTEKALVLTEWGSLQYNGKDVILINDYGIGQVNSPPIFADVNNFSGIGCGFYSANSVSTAGLAAINGGQGFHGGGILTRYSGGNENSELLLMANYGTNWIQMVRKGNISTAAEHCSVYTTRNTTKDANGNLKAASPVIKVFADYIELNDESEGVTLEKISTGLYKLKGTLGMNSDASWGGYNGGIVIPKGINGLELVWADYKVLADGDILIETHYRKHADLPPPILLKRLTTYPEFMDDQGNELESYAPCDIPVGHWIDVRVNMPSDSTYNQKLAEAERLAKIEAERVAKEEAEKTEQEAEEREKYELGENDILP
ncbi:phage tail fiber protein [Providencia rustigianii]|uniref:phage tail fiber protein n=1 Tax=Providencia rustigianii TaxID=158850 RepID=UPI00223ED691|nr:hypothetical protein [Providencia rustigianii]